MRKKEIILKENPYSSLEDWWFYNHKPIFCQRGFQNIFPLTKNAKQIKLIISEKPVDLTSKIVEVMYSDNVESIRFDSNKSYSNISSALERLIKNLVKEKEKSYFLCLTAKIICKNKF